MRLIYKFGQGRGFGAELMETLWLSYRCRLLGIEFAFQSDAYPTGVAAAKGWNDYFVAAYETVRAEGPRSKLNRHMYSRTDQWLTRPVARTLLNNLFGSRNRYIFDHQRIEREAADLQRRAQNGEDGLPSIHSHASALYRLLPEVKGKIGPSLSTGRYIAVHIRRGDKISEAAYADLSLYVAAVEKIPDWQRLPFYVLSDSSQAAADFVALVRPRDVLGTTQNAGTGYDQKTFNQLPPSARYRETLSVIADLEIARRSAFFVGTSTSNIMWLMKIIHERGGAAIRDVHRS